MFSTVTVFSCQRVNLNEGICELKVIRGPKNQETIKSYPLDDIKQANLKNWYSSSSKRTIYYTEITTQSSETLELPEIVYGPSGNRANVPQEINEFLNNPQQKSLVIQEEDSRWITYLIGGLFITFPNIIFVNMIYIGIKLNREQI